MTAHRIWIAGLAVLMMGALAVSGALFMRGQNAEGAVANDYELYVDCNPGGAIDDACSPAAGPVSVDVILKNTTGGGTPLIAGYNFNVRVDEAVAVPVVVSPCVAPKLNCNPDFAEVQGGINWSCNPVLADHLPDDPAIATSFLSCINEADANALADGASVKLADVDYNYNGGNTLVEIHNVNIYDETVTELMSCNPVVSQAGDCFNATLGAAAPTDTPVPTNTNTPLPTSTNTPLPTSTNTPLPTSTNTPLPTSTNTPLPTSTNTPLPTSTNTPLPTSTNTPLPTSTNTPLPTSTNTPLPTSTNTPEPTTTDTPVPTATDTPLAEPTNTPIPAATDTPLPEPTDTPVPTATNTPEASATAAATGTVEVTRTVSATKTVSVTETVVVETETPTNTPTNTPTSTSTSTSTPATPTVTHTSVPKTHTPTRTSTPASTSTRPPSTATAVSTVAGIATSRPGGAGGATALPNSGQGGSGATSDWMVGILSIAAAGMGLYGVVIMRRRLRS